MEVPPDCVRTTASLHHVGPAILLARLTGHSKMRQRDCFCRMVWLGLLLGGTVSASSQLGCQIAVSGTVLKPGLSSAWVWELEKSMRAALSNSSKHTIHAVTATNIPCGGFLRTDPYFIRSGASDVSVLKDINIAHEFSFLGDLLGQAPKTILDLGANIGLASAYFAMRYPKANIVAVEPSTSNFAMASINTYRATNVKILWGAVWPQPAFLRVTRADAQEWGFVMQELVDIDNSRAGTPIPGLTVDGIMQDMAWTSIDYLKVDIECGEYALFNNNTNIDGWISKVGCMTLELHRWCGKDYKTVLSVLSSAGLAFKGRYGELDTFCRI